MSKEENLLPKKRSFSFHNRPHQDRKVAKPCQASKIKKKIFQKHKFSFHKKSSPSKGQRDHRFSKKVKFPFQKKNQPPTPHNTTQFIVDAVYYPTDPRIYEYDNNRFEYDCQHHAMAGSMMQLMQQKFDKENIEAANPQARSPMIIEKCEEEGDSLLDAEIPKLRLVKSADDGKVTSYDSDDGFNFEYGQLLNEAKSGKDLHGVIKELVNVIRRKDNQINSLLLNNTQKKEPIQGS